MLKRVFIQEGSKLIGVITLKPDVSHQLIELIPDDGKKGIQVVQPLWEDHPNDPPSPPLIDLTEEEKNFVYNNLMDFDKADVIDMLFGYISSDPDAIVSWKADYKDEQDEANEEVVSTEAMNREILELWNSKVGIDGFVTRILERTWPMEPVQILAHAFNLVSLTTR
jgi:hypothetical protein